MYDCSFDTLYCLPMPCHFSPSELSALACVRDLQAFESIMCASKLYWCDLPDASWVHAHLKSHSTSVSFVAIAVQNSLPFSLGLTRCRVSVHNMSTTYACFFRVRPLRLRLIRRALMPLLKSAWHTACWSASSEVKLRLRKSKVRLRSWTRRMIGVGAGRQLGSFMGEFSWEKEYKICFA